jgi:hypothetical protein
VMEGEGYGGDWVIRRGGGGREGGEGREGERHVG